MTYAEFFNWCEERACDGRWSMSEAIYCISVIKQVESVCVKGLFKRRANEKAKKNRMGKITPGRRFCGLG